jgi:hypothetical protein
MDRIARPAFTRVAAALLVGAPLLMAVGRLLLVPMDDQKWDSVLTQAAANQGTSDTGWLMALAASGLLAAAALSMTALVHETGRRKAAAFATVAIALGWAGSAAICMGGVLFSYQGKAADRAAQVQLLTDFNAGHSAFAFLLCVLAAVGYIVLAVALGRSGTASKGAAFLVGLGGVATLLTMPGPLKALLVVAALVLLAGQTLVLRAVGTEITPTPAPAPNWEPTQAQN